MTMTLIIDYRNFRELKDYIRVVEEENQREGTEYGLTLYDSDSKKNGTLNLARIERKSKKQKLREELISSLAEVCKKWHTLQKSNG